MLYCDFVKFDQSYPEVWIAWELVCREQRLDPWRTRLSAGEIIEAVRLKGHTLGNDLKPWYSRKFNDRYGNDDGIKFVLHRLKVRDDIDLDADMPNTGRQRRAGAVQGRLPLPTPVPSVQRLQRPSRARPAVYVG